MISRFIKKLGQITLTEVWINLDIMQKSNSVIVLLYNYNVMSTGFDFSKALHTHAHTVAKYLFHYFCKKNFVRLTKFRVIDNTDTINCLAVMTQSKP